ncbi:MAG: hypothetical protein ABSG56_21120 [Bryobacteraceae bacterium]|jgi:hypothetical protein
MPAQQTDNVEQRLERLECGFREYLHAFNTEPPFTRSQLEHHLLTIELLRRFATASDAARDEGFADSLAATLKSWDVGVERHGQTLLRPPEFRGQLRSISMAVAELEDLRIDGPSIDVERAGHRIWLIVGDLDIVRYKSEPVKRKVVSGTKALHHLLPNLVFPMDNEYTATFFGWHDFGTDPEHRFKFRQVAAIARTVSPQSYVGEGWNTSVSKVLDNAIVGFCRSQGIMSRNKCNRRKKQAVLNLLKEAGLADPLEFARRLKEVAGTKLPPQS